ncbi:hypothetical protein FRC09_020325 [Ceratobasidium sp. 395]|nr:hypothetical protein FRC09_020325 [Ceratobasidium sp. 395]
MDMAAPLTPEERYFAINPDPEMAENEFKDNISSHFEVKPDYGRWEAGNRYGTHSASVHCSGSANKTCAIFTCYGNTIDAADGTYLNTVAFVNTLKLTRVAGTMV